MTVAESQPIDPPVSADGEPAVSVPLTFQCPFVSSGDGAWRAATATRDHRCAAVTPPAPVAIEKQRRLCLTPEHQTCATFVAAEAASGELPGRATGLPRPVARTTPVVLDRHRLGTAVPTILANRSTGQTVLVAVLMVAFLVVVVARSAVGGGSPLASPSAQPTATVRASATARPSSTVAPTASPRSTPSAAATPAPTARTSATPKPRATKRPSTTKRSSSPR
jgi:hypothetical protein